jgi:hypothetical protein
MSLKSLRQSAFHAQRGHCYYCAGAMWLSSPSELGLRTKSSRPYQCTGEHLQARQDGGGNIKSNIVAACLYCNAHRHRVKKPLTPEDYRAYVRKRVSMGRWYPTLRKM